MKLRLMLAAAMAAAASAQTAEPAAAPISTDRPGFTTTPGVVGRGVTQLETGVTFAREKDGDGWRDTVTVGSPLVRVGVARAVELRVAGDGLLLRRNDGGAGDPVHGWSDMGVGAKVAVVQEGRIRPAVSLVPSISLPTGEKAFTSSTYDPSLGMAWQKGLPAGVSVIGSVMGTAVSAESQRRGRYASAIAVWFPAPARLSGYVEGYGASSAGPGNPSMWVFDGGVSHSLGPNMQVDVEAGRRFCSGGPYWFAAAGFAVRHSLFKRREEQK